MLTHCVYIQDDEINQHSQTSEKLSEQMIDQDEVSLLINSILSSSETLLAYSVLHHLI